jgi:hypothetical protein
MEEEKPLIRTSADDKAQELWQQNDLRLRGGYASDSAATNYDQIAAGTVTTCSTPNVAGYAYTASSLGLGDSTQA